MFSLLFTYSTKRITIFTIAVKSVFGEQEESRRIILKKQTKKQGLTIVIYFVFVTVTLAQRISDRLFIIGICLLLFAFAFMDQPISTKQF